MKIFILFLCIEYIIYVAFSSKLNVIQSLPYFFHLFARKANLEKFSIYSNKFFHNFHLSLSWASIKWVNVKTVVISFLIQPKKHEHILTLFLEPWLCWSSRVARKFEDQLPYSSYDGSRQSYHYPCKIG